MTESADVAGYADGCSDGVPSGNGVFEFTVADLAREVIKAEAPGELDLLARRTAGWATENRAIRRRRSRAGGGSVGSGLSPILLSDTILPLLTGTVAQVIGGVAVAKWLDRRKRKEAADLAKRWQATPTDLVLLRADFVDRKSVV